MLSFDFISSAHTPTSYSRMQRMCVLAYVVWAEKKIKIRIEQIASEYFVTLSQANWLRDGPVNNLSGSFAMCHSQAIWSLANRLQAVDHWLMQLSNIDGEAQVHLPQITLQSWKDTLKRENNQK